MLLSRSEQAASKQRASSEQAASKQRASSEQAAIKQRASSEQAASKQRASSEQAASKQRASSEQAADTMTRLALERPDLKPTEVLAAAVLAHNEVERVRGFSLAQWALGRAPNWDQSFFDSGNETPDPSFLEHLQRMETARDAWLKARNEERLRRASRARNRLLAHFRPDDEVDFWRRGTGKGARPHIKGRFHGGAVVLATSTEIGEHGTSTEIAVDPRRCERMVAQRTI